MWTVSLHESNLNQADHHAPLRRREGDNKRSCVECEVKRWIEKGLSRNKTVLTIPLFGVAWKLPSETDLTNLPVKADGYFPYQFKDEKKVWPGWVPYHEICNPKNSWKVLKEADQTMGPYALRETNPRIWVGYDDPAMAVIKSNYILSEGLGGAAVYDLVMEDTDGVCGGGTNPIVTAISQTLNSLKSSLTSSSTTIKSAVMILIIGVIVALANTMNLKEL